MPSSVYIECTYIKRNGSICGKGSVIGLCGVHSRRNPQRACSLCGKGTQSATGICTTPGRCKAAQHTALGCAKRRAARKTASLSVLYADLDAAVDELLEDFAENKTVWGERVRDPLTIMNKAAQSKDIVEPRDRKLRTNELNTLQQQYFVRCC